MVSRSRQRPLAPVTASDRFLCLCTHQANSCKNSEGRHITISVDTEHTPKQFSELKIPDFEGVRQRRAGPAVQPDNCSFILPRRFWLKQTMQLSEYDNCELCRQARWRCSRRPQSFPYLPQKAVAAKTAKSLKCEAENYSFCGAGQRIDDCPDQVRHHILQPSCLNNSTEVHTRQNKADIKTMQAFNIHFI